MVAENAEGEVVDDGEVIIDAEPQPITEKEAKRLPSKKTKEKIGIEEFGGR